MNKKEKIAIGIFLLVIAAVCGFFAIVEFDSICRALRTCFTLGYLMTAVPGIISIMEATGNLPDFSIKEEE